MGQVSCQHLQPMHPFFLVSSSSSKPCPHIKLTPNKRNYVMTSVVHCLYRNAHTAAMDSCYKLGRSQEELLGRLDFH